MGMFQLNVVLVLLSVVYIVKGSNDRCYSEFSSEQYVGCFVDNPSRILRDVFHVQGKNSVPYCRQFCAKRNYALAGVQYSKECFCGNKMVIENKRQDHECNMQCTGSQEKCGGVWKMNVYSTEGLEYFDYFHSDYYVGCYVDYHTRLLPDKRTDSADNSIHFCVNLCKNAGFQYAGVEYYKECFCSNDLHGKVQKVKDSDCNTKCRSTKSEDCGGTWRISVYKTANTPLFEDEMTVDYSLGCDFCQCTWEDLAFVSTCSGAVCAQIHCQEQEQLEGECCPTCKVGCFEKDVEYKNGDTMPSSDKCKTCTCEVQGNSGFMKTCSSMACIHCPYGVEDDGTCCGRCKDEEEDEEDEECLDECPETECKPKHLFKTDDMCCEECMCKVGKTLINPGPFGDACDRCVCKNGEIICDPTPCPPVQCADPVKPDGSCCYTCPNGPTCRYKKKMVILAGEQVSVGKKVCMCDPFEWHPNALCRSKKVKASTFGGLKDYQAIIDLPKN